MIELKLKAERTLVIQGIYHHMNSDSNEGLGNEEANELSSDDTCRYERRRERHYSYFFGGHIEVTITYPLAPCGSYAEVDEYSFREELRA